MKLYALVDLKGRDIVTVFQSVSDEAAERSFLRTLTDGITIVSDFPDDFAVFYVGELSVQHGSLDVSCNLEDVGLVGYKVSEPIKRGSDYDRRYLRMVAEDRVKVPLNVSDKDGDKDEKSDD